MRVPHPSWEAPERQALVRRHGPGALLEASAVSYVSRVFRAAGVELGGRRPFDPQIVDPRFYRRVLAHGSLGLGEAYVDGLWECEQLDELFARVLRNGIDDRAPLVPEVVLRLARRALTNAQSLAKAATNVRAHYDRDNALYEAMLDSRMIYSCGYWREARDLEAAQEAKLELVCQKLGLAEGRTVLDIGCGWGGFVKYAAERYGVRAVGITLSARQAEVARERCAGLPVEIRLEDYRALHGSFDRIVSIGMMEHVGVKNYRTFFEVAHRCLKPDGLFLLHTIGNNVSTLGFDPWMDRYIFPGAQLPSAAQLARAAERLFVLEDLHNFGADYDRTLMAWRANFERRWPELEARYDERFFRMWRYYLSLCAGGFRSRLNQLYQLVLSKKGVEGGYRSIR